MIRAAIFLIVVALVTVGLVPFASSQSPPVDVDAALQALETRYSAEVLKPVSQQSGTVYEEIIDGAEGKVFVLEMRQAASADAHGTMMRLKSLSIAAQSARDKVRAAAEDEKRRHVITSKAWPDEIKRLVIDRRVSIGMTTEQAEAAWGKPKSVRETITAGGRAEFWTYASGGYLYFVNGRLSVIDR